MASTNTGGSCATSSASGDGLNVNIRLVAVGAAAPYFYRHRRGKYANRLLDLRLAVRRCLVDTRGCAPPSSLKPSVCVASVQSERTQADPSEGRTLPFLPSSQALTGLGKLLGDPGGARPLLEDLDDLRAVRDAGSTACSAPVRAQLRMLLRGS
jgi:hypothetical protein